jgi:hypothetical protein
VLAASLHRKFRKLPILLLVFFMCVQSLGFASHVLMVSPQTEMQNAVVEHKTPPCHDKLEIAITEDHTQITPDLQMPCCDDGQCADAHCMTPTGTHFNLAIHDYFIAHSRDVVIACARSLDSVRPSPPIRPPIA